ncbi:MAG: PfkB family carbohydrate kinase [Puniceicoccaceae bacterium]
MEEYTRYLDRLSGRILLGCDGFVDETFQLVDERRTPAEFTPIDRLKDFGELLVRRADGGVGIEIVPKRRCEGGFAINTARVPAILGLRPAIAGLFGGTEIDPAFKEFEDITEMVSLGDPALTLAFEFADGKLLMSNVQAVANLGWDRFEELLPEDRLRGMFADVDILGLGYWSLTADFDGLFEGFMARYENTTPPRRMFFDFADLKKKSHDSFLKSLELIRKHNQRIPMTFSLNEHEILELFSRFGVGLSAPTPEAMASALAEARAKLGIDELVVHTPDFAAASGAGEGEAVAIQERQTDIVRLAGAGDSFNGGYLSASLGNLPMKKRLAMANATTAFFVTRGTTPTREELIAQIEKAADK